MADIITPEQLNVLAEQVKQILAAESQGVGDITKVKSLDGVYSLPALLFSGTGEDKVVEAPLALLRISLRKSAGGIDWRQGDDGQWQTLISIQDITGPQGETPVFRTGANGIEWKYKTEADTAWRELVSIEQLKLTFDMLTESQKEAIRGYSAYQLWEQEEGNTGKTYQQFKDWMKQEALEAADTANEAALNTNQVKDDTLQVKEETKAVQIVTDKTRIATDTERIDSLIVREETKTVQTKTDKTRVEVRTVQADTLKVQGETKAVQNETDTTRIKTKALIHATKQVQEETKAVQNLTDNTRIESKAVLTDSLLLQEETRAVQEAIKQTRINTEQVKVDTLKVQEETKAVQIATDKTRIETETVKADTLKVKDETIAISEIAKELNAHPLKPIDGYWFCWDLEKKDYVNSKIQAKGEVGSSFKIVGRYDTLEALTSAVPDGTDIDGVYAVGIEEPYSYYAWLVVDGVWKWDNQGQLRGAQGKSAFDVWLEDPANTGKTIIDFFNFLSPYIGDNKNWWVRDHDSEILAEGVSVNLQVLKNTPAEYILKFIYAGGEVITPNLQGHSCNAVQDIDHIPGEDDTSFVYEDVTYNHSVGDRRRYYNPKKKKYEMYTLMDINSEGKATWEIAGSGDADGIVFLSAPAHLNKSYITIKNGGLEE